MSEEMKRKLTELLDRLYDKESIKGLLAPEDSMKDLLNIVLENDLDSLDELLADY